MIPDLSRIVVTDDGKMLLIPLNTLREMILWCESEGKELIGLVLVPTTNQIKTDSN